MDRSWPVLGRGIFSGPTGLWLARGDQPRPIDGSYDTIQAGLSGHVIICDWSLNETCGINTVFRGMAPTGARMFWAVLHDRRHFRTSPAARFPLRIVTRAGVERLRRMDVCIRRLQERPSLLRDCRKTRSGTASNIAISPLSMQRGMIRAVQPFFLLDQDLLEGLGPESRFVSFVRRYYPRDCSSCGL